MNDARVDVCPLVCLLSVRDLPSAIWKIDGAKKGTPHCNMSAEVASNQAKTGSRNYRFNTIIGNDTNYKLYHSELERVARHQQQKRSRSAETIAHFATHTVIGFVAYSFSCSLRDFHLDSSVNFPFPRSPPPANRCQTFTILWHKRIS